VNGDARVSQEAIDRRQRLGRALRQLRTDAGLTQEFVGEELGLGQAKIYKIERTLCGIEMDWLERLIKLYGVEPAKAAELRDLAAQDLKNGPARMSGSAFTVLTDLELEAAEILCWHQCRIPGPLKSEPYLLAQWASRLTEAKMVEVLRKRAARMRVLTMPDPPSYRVILDQSSLYRLPGGFTPEMLNEQVSHLLDLTTKYSRLELRVLLFEAAVPHVDPDFELVRFNGRPGYKDFVYLEDSGGPRQREKRDELKRFRDHWAVLDGAALSVAETKEFLAGLIL
jgi:transcriptional regulator with XRE-family HTH domain